LQSGDIDGRWEHDMYEGGRKRSAGPTPFGGGGGGSAKLTVSNLDFGVSDSDITVCMPLARPVGMYSQNLTWAAQNRSKSFHSINGNYVS